ncbi:MAG TPA: recombinase family protein [Caproiciproducens sp.]|nr:recombinase family protein [Caproiciproducens sp.]
MQSAVAYARYSSDNQREESIEAQVRAIKYFASNYGYDIVKVYADKAMTGRTSDRPQFLKMIDDSKSGLFQAVIVHKLDRFSRDSLDTLYYEKLLRMNNVQLISVNERLDQTPEGALMKQVIIGMNQFYSANLAREVMKGLKENAYECLHTGGMPPLGYDVDKDKKYIINETEAVAVRLIFKMYAQGNGYSQIIDALNSKGYKTKLGRPFGKNSLHEILCNEKYNGTYIYNRIAPKDIRGRVNRHKLKDPDQIIRIPGGVPAIVDKDTWATVQQKMKSNFRKAGRNMAKAQYLLSGKLFCGHCGAAMTGEARRYKGKYEYFYYVCSNAKRTKSCDKKPIDRDIIEKAVIDKINEKIFSNKNINEICSRIYESYQAGDTQAQASAIKREILAIDRKIANVMTAIKSGGTAPEFYDTVNDLSEQKKNKQVELFELTTVKNSVFSSVQDVVDTFKKTADFALLPFDKKKLIVDRFIYKIFVYDKPDGFKIRIVMSTTNPTKDVINFLDTKGNALPLPNQTIKSLKA